MPKNLKDRETKTNKTIAEQLIEKYGFHPIKTNSSQRDKIDIDQFSCMLRVHVLHYLFYSEIHKHFSIAIRPDNPKKDTNGDYIEWITVMIPKTIHTFKEAEQLIHATVNVNHLQLY